MTNMDAELIFKERHIVSENAFVEIVLWRVPSSVFGSTHKFKYRLAFVINGCCVLRYDNEQGKGDHKHIGKKEIPYNFTTPQTLLDDFWNDVDDWRV